MVVPYVPEDLLFPLDAAVTAGPLHTADLNTGASLEFRAFIEVDGIFSHIEGLTTDARWPKDLSVPRDLVNQVERQLLVLPPLAALRTRESAQLAALSSLLRFAPETFDSVRLVLHEPATEASLANLSLREAARIPSEYLSLLQISDGLRVGDLELLGTRDAYQLDIPNTNRLIIAWVNGDGDDSVLVLDRSGNDESVYLMAIHDPAIASRRVASGILELISGAIRTARDAPASANAGENLDGPTP